MSENWVMLCTGFFLIVGGLAMTHVSGAMPGSKPLYAAPLRFRLIVIFFGGLMFLLGLTRLIRS
jgi:hypothetical protein